MRFLLSVPWLAIVACTPSERAIVANSGCQYNSLGQVTETPRRAGGKMLCAELYSYSKHGFLAFYDQPVQNITEALQTESLLIGDEEGSENFGKLYPLDGQRVEVQGILRIQLTCFVGAKNSCVPIRKPIYVYAPKLSIIAK
ncbi:MAG TPA: hypothetical protein VE053_04720 [Allosphingosinicella sp.]|nr:hypothetical protein [Allosphingosinicella sp.]